VEKLDKYLKITAILLSLAYIAGTVFAEEKIVSLMGQNVIWMIAPLVALNLMALFVHLLRGKIFSPAGILLHLIYIGLFYPLYTRIRGLSLSLHEWGGFSAVHGLRAADILDGFETFGILPFEKSDPGTLLSNVAILCMYLPLGFFVLAMIFRLVHRRSQNRQRPPFISKWLPPVGLFAAMAVFVIFGRKAGLGSDELIRWIPDNILHTLDIGDALQIFGRHSHNPEKNRILAGAAVLFRAMFLCMTIILLNWLYLRIKTGRVSVDKLAGVCMSSEHPPEERIDAIRSLEQFGTFADTAIPHLVKLLTDANPDIRAAAKETLEGIDDEWPESEAARGAVPDLVKLLLSPDRNARSAAGETLEKIDPRWPESEAALGEIPSLVSALFQKDRFIRIAGAEALGKIGQAASKSVSHLIKALSDSDNDVCRAVAEAIGEMGPAAEEAVPHLIKAMTRPDVQTAAVLSMGKIGHSAVPILIRALGNRERNVRIGSVKALEIIDLSWRESDTAQQAVEDFVKTLEDSFSSDRYIAAQALGIIDAPEVVPNLINVLADAEEEVRKAARGSLESIDSDWPRGQIARKAVPRFIKSLTASDTEVRKAATEILEKIDAKWRESPIARKAIPHFVRALSDPLETVRSAGARALGEIGPAAAKAIPHLVKASGDNVKEVRDIAGEALKKIDPAWQKNKSTSQAMPRFVRDLKNKDWRIRSSSAAALGKMGSAAVKTIPYLVKLLTDMDKRVRVSAIEALESIDPMWRESKGARKAFPHFMKALGSSQWIVRVSAVKAFEEIGPSAAQEAAPHLAKALKDSVVDVQTAAKEALDKIDPKGKLREKEIAAAYVLTAAEKALGDFDPGSPEALPHLVKKLIDTDRAVRKAAREVLGKMDAKWPRNKAALRMIPYLIKEGLSDGRWVVRASSAEALGDFGTAAAKTAVPRLVKAMNIDSTMDVRSAAKKALDKIDPTGKLRKQV